LKRNYSAVASILTMLNKKIYFAKLAFNLTNSNFCSIEKDGCIPIRVFPFNVFFCLREKIIALMYIWNSLIDISKKILNDYTALESK